MWWVGEREEKRLFPPSTVSQIESLKQTTPRLFSPLPLPLVLLAALVLPLGLVVPMLKKKLKMILCPPLNAFQLQKQGSPPKLVCDSEINKIMFLGAQGSSSPF